MKNHFYIQARIDSKRFPNKVLKKICDKSIIQLIAERLETLNKIGSILVVTGEKNKNTLLIDEAKKINLDYLPKHELPKRHYEPLNFKGCHISDM